MIQKRDHHPTLGIWFLPSPGFAYRDNVFGWFLEAGEGRMHFLIHLSDLKRSRVLFDENAEIIRITLIFTLLSPDPPGTYGIPLVSIGILRLASLETTFALNDAFGANVMIPTEFSGCMQTFVFDG